MAPKYKVCPQCEGEGRMVARHSQVWTQSDREQDPEGFQAMLDGQYDQQCDMCQGLRVVTARQIREFGQRREDHFTHLQEMGIYPGSSDYY